MNTVRAFTLLFFLLSGGASVAYATEYGDVGVTLQSPSPGQSAHGYAEYRVSVVNRSALRRHVVRLNLPDPRVAYGGVGELEGVSRTVVVEPGATAQVSLWQPCLPLNGPGGLGVEIDGRLMRESVPGTAAQQAVGGYGYRSPLFLQSQGINKTGLQGLFTDALKTLGDDAKRAQEAAAEASAPPASAPTGVLAEIVPLLSYNGSLAFSFAVAETSVAEWSANWLSYSRYDAILLTGDELRDSPPPVRAALWRMVEAGGALFVLGAGEPPPEWRFRKRAVGGLTVCDAGFGQCVFANPSKIADVTPADWFALWKLAQAPQEFWTPYPTAQEANEKFPVIEKIAIPLRGLFLFILIFALVIGPANFLILRKLNRRLWLLWTVPAFSLLTSAGVAVYALFSEGFTAYERVAAFTVLNEPARQATTIGVVAYYSTLTPGDGLHFGAETFISERKPRSQRSGSSIPTAARRARLTGRAISICNRAGFRRAFPRTFTFGSPRRAANGWTFNTNPTEASSSSTDLAPPSGGFRCARATEKRIRRKTSRPAPASPSRSKIRPRRQPPPLRSGTSSSANG